MRQVIAVMDASKLGMISTNKVCEPSQIHVIITDDNVELELVERFKQRDIQVLCV